MSSTASPETPFWLEINGRRRTCWTCSPQHVDTLVIGYLFTSGYIQSLEELQSLELLAEPTGCAGGRVTVPEAHATRVSVEQRTVREHGCGVLHWVNCAPPPFTRPPAVPVPDGDVLRHAFRALFAATDAAFPEGGMHAAGLFVEGALRHTTYDVGRHNAVDRAFGIALRERIDLANAGLLLSARVSGAMALKAARGGIGWVASRSIPTTLAQTFADSVGLPLVARAGRALERGSDT